MTAIGKEVVKAAAGNSRNGKEVMRLLLGERGTDIQITEEVVKAAVGNFKNGKEVMTLLLEQRGGNAVIIEEVVKAAATSGQEEVIKVIEKILKFPLSEEEWPIAQFYNAAKAGKQYIIQNLLAQGFEPDLKNPRNVSPLWIAATNGYPRVVELLLGTKAVDANSKSISGRPPIFWVAAMGNESVVRFLLQAGADPTLMDKDGRTVLSMVKQYGHNKIAKLLASK